MLRKIKMRLLAVAFVAITVTLLSQESLAYYTALGTATNVVTSGSIRMVIHETTAQGTPYPEEGVYVIPGDIISKVVTVENDCAHPFYLRVKAVYGSDSQELTAQECLKLNINTEVWHLRDGWYYYTGILQPGEMSPWFFSQVEIVGSQVDSGDIGKTLRLSVVAQAVQSENNPIENGDVSTARGWPAEQEVGG